jgi:hypothetical protein
MKISITLYDALIAAHVPADKGKHAGGVSFWYLELFA